MTSRKMVTTSLFIALVFAIAGCSGQGNNPKPSSSTAPAQQPVTQISDQPGSVEGYAGAREDVEISTCAPQGDKFKAAGKVTNPTKAAQHYRIYVSVLNGEGATLALVQTDVASVAAGGNGQWGIEAATTGENLRCVLRVERFPA